ncbi:MAG: threonine ammonia-lyase, partial [Candidatus Lokiarchaeota archaeon]|nr:threonine ammonia-lyase [Candidatus Lokiarchaeota archaeon]
MTTNNYTQEIEAIRRSFGDLIHKTPLNKSNTFSRMCSNEVYLKLENIQRTGSFKIRGAYNKISRLPELERKKGVITASAGNHGQAVSLAAKLFGIKSTIIVPEGAPIVKIEAIKNYNPNGNVIERGRSYDEAYQEALKIQESNGMTFVHAYNDLDVIKGQATIGVEILEQLPDVNHIICPIGGGGLISGLSSYCKAKNPDIQIIGVQSENARSMSDSYHDKKITRTLTKETICDGIAVKEPGKITYDLIKKNVDDIILVSDEEVANAILLLMERSKLFVEGAGAAALAALLNNKISVKNKKIVVIVSGGNLTPNLISRIINKGLIKEGRLLKVQMKIPDTPGALLSVLKIIAEQKGNVVSIIHDRERLELEYLKSEVIIELETRNFEHINQIVSKLKEQ